MKLIQLLCARVPRNFAGIKGLCLVFLNALLVKTMMMCLWYYSSIEICGTVWRHFYFSSNHRQSKHSLLTVRSTCNKVNCQICGLTVCQSLILLSHHCCVCTTYFLVMGRECIFSLASSLSGKRSSFSSSGTGTITINFFRRSVRSREWCLQLAGWCQGAGLEALPENLLLEFLQSVYSELTAAFIVEDWTLSGLRWC